MKKQQLILAFAFTALLQLLIPAKMIYDSEVTEKEGAEFKFKTVPIDPTDPFRGKYVTLDYEISSVQSADTTFQNDEQVYVVLQKDEQGFAKVASVEHQEPDNTANYVIAEVNYSYGGKISLEFMFNRFYMEEGKAPIAESAYAEYSSTKTAKPAYAVIAVKDGTAVVKDVIVNGISLKKYVEKQNNK